MIVEFFLLHKIFCILLLFWLFCSLVVGILYAIDKTKSIKESRRISEKTLLLWSVVGSLGAIVGIYLLGHKSLHLYFSIIALESLLLQGILLYSVY